MIAALEHLPGPALQYVSYCELYLLLSTKISRCIHIQALMKMDMNKLPMMDLDENGNTIARFRWRCKNAALRWVKISILVSIIFIKLCYRRRKNRIVNKMEASVVITNFFRCIRARVRVVKVAKQVYARVWDSDYEQYFYSNLLNGESSWSKQKILLCQDVPLLISENENKRSPRINREITMYVSWEKLV